MEIFPAIDLMDGKAVRLTKGKKESKKIYGDPLEFASKFEKYFENVHIVDLDGAFSGKPKNLKTVEKIIKETDLTVQLGGGIRDISSLEKITEMGVSFPIIGTKAFDPSFRNQAGEICRKLTASLDVKEDKVALKGWKEKSSLPLEEAYRKLKGEIDRFVYTAVKKDGEMNGVGETEKFWEEEEVLYAGGVTDLADLRRLSSNGFGGAIVGKSIYEGKLKLAEVAEEF